MPQQQSTMSKLIQVHVYTQSAGGFLPSSVILKWLEMEQETNVHEQGHVQNYQQC